MEKGPLIFNYQIIESQGFCIVSFTGYFSSRFAASFEECAQKIVASECKSFVLNFAEVSFVERPTHRFLVQLQKNIKDEKNATFKICSLKAHIKTELVDYGIVKNGDYSNDLKSALAALKSSPPSS